MKRLLILLAAVGLLAAGCGDTTDPDTIDQDPTSTTVNTVPPATSSNGWDPSLKQMARENFAGGANLDPNHPFVVCAVDWIAERHSPNELGQMVNDEAAQERLAVDSLNACYEHRPEEWR